MVLIYILSFFNFIQLKQHLFSSLKWFYQRVLAFVLNIQLIKATKCISASILFKVFDYYQRVCYLHYFRENLETGFSIVQWDKLIEKPVLSHNSV